MIETWKNIEDFRGYSVSDFGRVKSEKSDRILRVKVNQLGIPYIGMMREGIQYQRSVSRLVATTFLDGPEGAFDTPINLDGDRFNNHVENLVWRPRWFAVKYNRQFKDLLDGTLGPVQDLDTGEVFQDSFEAAKHSGLLEYDLVEAIRNETPVWPTYQEFQIVGA
jgi:hypothetical protein